MTVSIHDLKRKSKGCLNMNQVLNSFFLKIVKIHFILKISRNYSGQSPGFLKGYTDLLPHTLPKI